MRVWKSSLKACVFELCLLAAVAGTLLLANVATAEPLSPVKIWPGKVPGEKGDIEAEKILDPRGGKPVTRITNVTEPTVTVFPAPKDKANGAAVVICPGGGYSILAYDLEGEEVAEWLNSIGVTGILLKYRVPRREGLPKHLAPLQDAQRAVSLARSKASEWNIDPNRIGILGFSAGGHLSATASTNYDQRQYEPIDEVDKVSCRPDFTVLVYPAYLLADGSNTELSSEIRVSKDTPPMFFAHAGDDRLSPENSIALYLALKRLNIPASLHVYSKGGHGFGLRKTEDPCCTWPDSCAAWLKREGWLSAKSSK